MSYPYFKYLISRYNEYSSLYGMGEQILLKHTMRRDPYEILQQTQKLEWTKFLQTVFDWFVSTNSKTSGLQRDSNMELSVDYQSGASNGGEITSDDAMAPFKQGMKKLTNAYTIYFNQFKEFVMSFVDNLPMENLKIFLKNLTFYSGSGVRSDILGFINMPAHMMEDIDRRKIMQEIFEMCIASFYQTGKIPILGEKYLDIGDITLPPDTENFPDTIRLYFQYRDQYLIQSIVLLQAIAMWLYAFNSQHLELVRTTMQEFYMNLTYESLRYPEDNMRFYLIESLMNNFNYKLMRYVSEMTDGLDARDSSSTYNKFIENDEKLNVSLEEVKLRQREQELQNEILRDNVEKQMAKQLTLDRKLDQIMEDKPQLEWEYHDDDDKYTIGSDLAF